MLGKKVLIIEDDSVMSESLTYSLRAKGYKVESAITGTTGISLCRKFDPDLLILDLVLPDTHGLEVLDEIRSNDWGKDLKVLILTNVENETLKRKLFTMDIVDYLMKINTTLSKVIETVDISLSDKKSKDSTFIK